VLRSSDWLDVAAGRPLRSETIDEADLEIAVGHGLVGLLAMSSNTSIRSAVNPVAVRLDARQRVMRAHLRELLVLLADAGVRTTVLKGAALAEWAYEVPSMRTFTDIDLLVSAVDLPAALEALESYQFIQSIPPKRPKADKREILVVDDSGVSFSVDLHWDLFSYAQLSGLADGATEWAWDRADHLPNHPLGPMDVLPQEARIAFLATHATLDHRFRLILFRDLAEVARLEPDWTAVVEYAMRWRLRSFVYTALLLAKRWVDAPVPDEVLADLRVPSGPQRAIERLTRRIDPVTFDGHEPHLLNLAFVTLHDSPMQRARLVVRAPSAVPHWWKRVTSEQAKSPKRRRSALIVLTSNRRRGAEVFGAQLADGLRSTGWSIQTVALASDRGGAVVDAEPLVDEPPSALGRLNSKVVRELRKQIRNRRPDVVLANGSATLKYTAAALVGMRHRSAFVYASIGEPSYWAKGSLRRRLQRWLLRRVDAIAAVSSATARQLTGAFRIPTDKVQVAYTGVPDRYLDSNHSHRPGGDLRIIMVGALTREKQPQVGVQVLAELAKHHPAQLRMVGAGNLGEAVLDEAIQLGLADRVELVGSVEDVGPHFEWADVLLLTSSTEGLPGVILEAAAAGVPSVAFDVGGTQEAVIDGVTGFIVQSRDVAAAAGRLRELAEHPDRLTELGQAAKQRVRSEFRMTHAVERYEAVLTKAIERRR
jgi:glycosyltransferase involved in cell wall biosynthesis